MLRRRQALLILLLACVAAAHLHHESLRRTTVLLTALGSALGAGVGAGLALAGTAGAYSALAALMRHGGSLPGRRFTDQRRGGWPERMSRWSEPKFKRFYRVSRARFKSLCADLSDPALRVVRRNGYGRGASAEQVVGACLRRLASGEDYFAVAEDHGISEALLCERFPVFCRAINKLYMETTITLPTGAEIRRVQAGFQTIHGLVGCCGAIDGTHFPFRPPADEKAGYLNRKGYTSVNTIIMCDHARRIRHVSTGWGGSAHDARVFRHSGLGQLMLEGKWPPNDYGTVVEGVYVNAYALTDAAFPDCPGGRLIKPYAGVAQLGQGTFKEKFNYKQSGTRMPIEHVNGMLKRRWRLLLRQCEIWSVADYSDTIIAACILHNKCIDDGCRLERWGDEESDDEELIGNDVQDNDEPEDDGAAPCPPSVDVAGTFAAMHALGVYAGC